MYALPDVYCQRSPVVRFDRPNAKATSELEWDAQTYFSLEKSRSLLSEDTAHLQKVVFGWYPYWNGTQYTNFNFSLLSDVAYFAYEVDPNSGKPSNLHYWKTTPLVELAKASGTRVSLTATLFSGHKTFFSSVLSRKTLIDSLIYQLKEREATGINLDFEAVPSSQRDSLTAFVKELSHRFRDSVPNSYLSIALPAVDWNNAFDVVGLEPYLNLFIIMGYDYYYPGSEVAGPVSPKNSGSLWAPYDVTRSVKNYLSVGIPSSKLCLGVSYYGYQWKVTNKEAGSQTLSQGIALVYNTAVSNASVYRRLWDENASVPWYQYLTEGGRYQCWFDDSASLSLKYDMVNAYHLAGIGIWALGYDRSQPELWNVLREKFSDAGSKQTEGTFTDMGGPKGSYFSADRYWQRFSTSDSCAISCLFTSFSLATGDTLFAFEGSSLIGSYTGSLDPFLISGSKGLQFYFTSDSAEVSSGWTAHWHAGTMVLSGSLQLWPDTLSDSRPAGSFIGKLGISDTAAFSFSLWGQACTDHAFFRISGDSLFSTADFYYPEQSAYTLTIASKAADVLAIDQKTIHLIAKRTASDLQVATKPAVILYPNPCYGTVYIESPVVYKAVKLLDDKGRLLKKIDLIHGITRVDLPGISPGMYHLVKEGVWAQTLVVVK